MADEAGDDKPKMTYEGKTEALGVTIGDKLKGDDGFTFSSERPWEGHSKEHRQVLFVNDKGENVNLNIACPDARQNNELDGGWRGMAEQALRAYANTDEHASISINGKKSDPVSIDEALKMEREALQGALAKAGINVEQGHEISDSSCGLAPNLTAAVRSVGNPSQGRG